MSKLPAFSTFEFLRKTHFVPLLLVWPLASGLSDVFSYFRTLEPARRGLPRPARKNRYRLDTDSSHVLTLPDGRKLGYAEYGCPTGIPIFGLHGYPGDRLEGAIYEANAKKHNARIIMVERPGYGWSSPQPKRQVIDHAKDVELLAEHLGLKEYLVMGTSGGGPYALACAAYLPADKLKGVAIVVGMGTPDMSNSGMFLLNRAGWSVAHRYMPWLVKWYMSRELQNQLHLDDEYRLELMLKDMAKAKMHPKDAAAWSDTERRDDMLRLFLRRTREQYGQGLDHIVSDAKVMTSDWGFRFEDIRRDLPMDLWYGRFDGNVAPVHGELIAERLGAGAKLRMLDETHLSLQMNYEEEILMSLLEKL